MAAHLLLKSLAIYSTVPPPPSRGTDRDPSVSAHRLTVGRRLRLDGGKSFLVPVDELRWREMRGQLGIETKYNDKRKILADVNKTEKLKSTSV